MPSHTPSWRSALTTDTSMLGLRGDRAQVQEVNRLAVRRRAGPDRGQPPGTLHRGTSAGSMSRVPNDRGPARATCRRHPGLGAVPRMAAEHLAPFTQNALRGAAGNPRSPIRSEVVAPTHRVAAAVAPLLPRSRPIWAECSTTGASPFWAAGRVCRRTSGALVRLIRTSDSRHEGTLRGVPP